MLFRLLDILHPLFGSVSICECSLGDAERDDMLVKYANDGVVKRDLKGNLSANLTLRSRSFVGGFVRLSFDSAKKIERVFLVMSTEEKDEWLQTYISPFTDYLLTKGYYETKLDAANNHFLFRNALNEITIEIYDGQIVLDLHYPDDSVETHTLAFQEGASKTLEMMNSNATDKWRMSLMQRRAEDARRMCGEPSRPAVRPTPSTHIAVDIPEGAKFDENGNSLWQSYIVSFSGKPRLFGTLQQAKVYVNSEGDTFIVGIPVQVESQKNWLKERMLGELIQGYSALARERRVQIAIVVQ